MTGGAGYVGGHVVRALSARGDRVVVLDDLTSGDAARLGAAELVVGSVLDRGLVRRTLLRTGADGVVHLAARKCGDESLRRPDWYERENTGGLRAVLDAMADAGVRRLLASSSAAVYGAPARLPVPEEAPTGPTTPYGLTKLRGERMIAAEPGLRAVVFRYFNVAGAATPELADTRPVNLLTRVLAAVETGARPVVYGDRHPTPDGTCVRDYVHPEDVAGAHGAALPQRGRPRRRGRNGGPGRGRSVLEVLDTVAEVTGVRLRPLVAPPRAGDPPAVVAAVDRITGLLGWRAAHDLRGMVASAWDARSLSRCAG